MPTISWIHFFTADVGGDGIGGLDLVTILGWRLQVDVLVWMVLGGRNERDSFDIMENVKFDGAGKVVLAHVYAT